MQLSFKWQEKVVYCYDFVCHGYGIPRTTIVRITFTESHF